MAVIACAAADCRHNRAGVCSADQIAVRPGAVAVLPNMLEDTSRLTQGSWLVGYEAEFEAYRGYAQNHPGSAEPGAICQSFDP